MRVNYISPILFVLLIGTIMSASLMAQELNKEVYVTSTFRPEVADAEKISSMPDIQDTISLETTVDYTLLPSRIKTDYTPRTLKPATMVGSPLDKLYKSYLKLGFGNYASPLVEYSIHNLRSKDFAIGAYFFHKSSHTKLTLDNTAEVPAGYGRNNLSLYGKKFYKGYTATVDLGFKSHRVRQYGYNTANFIDSVPEPEPSDIMQAFMLFYAEAGIHSANGDSGAIDYSLGLRGEFFRDHFKNNEPHFVIKGDVSFPVGSFRVGVEGQFDHFKLETADSLYRESITTFKPFLLKRTNEWEIKLAGSVSIENSDKPKVYMYPDLAIRFQIVNKALITYFGLSGYLENNSYQSMATRNPYLIPGMYTKNTNHRIIAYAGLEGHLSRKTVYRIDVTFDAMEDMPIFLNDTNSLMQNTFGLVYDDADLIKLHGEYGWKPYRFLDFYVHLNYYNYKLIEQSKAWHKPNFDFTFSARYNFKEKIYLQLDYLFLGKRYAKNLYAGSPQIELNPAHDLNLKLEYKYSDILGGFVHLYNLLGQEYYLWNQYPGQRLNVMLGVSYKF